ncbi:nucleoside 2-deoxyribosyltransferase [candidate division KSB1 bacterium]|nr:nucleoside 2-deoxyribosyltransferase [candidate division KSB1 bacterium]
MKIYFAGSIRGGREERTAYQELIIHLKKFGQVLSEHIGDDKLGINGEKGITDTKIFKRDIEWLNQCDLVVAEVTVPSLGVGYELGRAEMMQKPVLCLFNTTKGARLSAMISGNAVFRVAVYDHIQAAIEEIERFVHDCARTCDAL